MKPESEQYSMGIPKYSFKPFPYFPHFIHLLWSPYWSILLIVAVQNKSWWRNRNKSSFYVQCSCSAMDNDDQIIKRNYYICCNGSFHPVCIWNKCCKISVCSYCSTPWIYTGSMKPCIFCYYLHLRICRSTCF